MVDFHVFESFLSLGLFGTVLGAGVALNQWWMCALAVIGSAVMDVRTAWKGKPAENKIPNNTPALSSIKTEDRHISEPFVAPEPLGRELCRSSPEHTTSTSSHNINPAVPALAEEPLAIFNSTPKHSTQSLTTVGAITNTTDEAAFDTTLELGHSHQEHHSQTQPEDTRNISEMESIDLAAALGFSTPQASPVRRPFSSLNRNGSTASLHSLLERPRSSFFASPSPFGSESVDDIVSMEFLEDTSRTAKSAPTPARTPAPSTPQRGISRASTAPATFPSVPRTPNFRDELAAFSARAAAIPTIDDVLSVYEASIAPSHLDKNDADLDREGFTSGDDDSQHDDDGVFTSDDEDDSSVFGSPAATSVDGGDVDPFDSLDSKANSITMSTAAKTATVVAAAAIIRRKQRPPPPKKKKMGKNNGHKRVPKKHRLSAAGKRKFVSTPFW
ncbi:hypothetical protein EX30DRAFT_351386 [Ascodesmis nigricans]|uniref:Uncharacterized protein n=1 Tax=Ascodesmis nigricans TaxID=341454 RepID=A0A4S2MR29_9PEZI|nr:hypothetical protein EX30DRAFT_351386 [Ascodesmis nigricans]